MPFEKKDSIKRMKIGILVSLRLNDNNLVCKDIYVRKGSMIQNINLCFDGVRGDL